jgi:hypothetical protein
MEANYEKKIKSLLSEINEIASVLPHGKRMQIFNRTGKVTIIFKKAVKNQKNIQVMDNKKAPHAKRLILQALLEGARITSYDANIIGHTVAGDRRIREIRKDHPVEDVWTQDEYGRRFKVYFMNPESIKNNSNINTKC